MATLSQLVSNISSVVSKHALSTHIHKIQKGTILLEAKPDIVVPTIDDIMGEKVLKICCGNQTVNKHTHDDEATKRVERV